MEFLVVLVAVVLGFAVLVFIIREAMKSVDETWTRFAGEFGLTYNGDPDDARLSGKYRSRPVEIHRKKTRTGSRVNDNTTTMSVSAIYTTDIELPLSENLMLYDDPGRQGALAEMVVDSLMGGGEFEAGTSAFDDNFDVAGSTNPEEQGAGFQQMVQSGREVESPEEAREFLGHEHVVEALRTLQEETTQETRIYLVHGNSNELKLVQTDDYDSLEDVRQNLDALVECADRLEEI